MRDILNAKGLTVNPLEKKKQPFCENKTVDFAPENCTGT
jgi:hypothetical protein